VFESISRSWQILGETWGVLRKDKELMLFPVLSGIVTIIVVLSFIIPFLFLGLSASFSQESAVILAFIFYFVTSAVVIFFNAALIGCAHIRLTGGNPTFSDGIRIAMRHIPAILSWALVAATIGLILRILSNRAGFIGRIIIALIGGIWSLVTFFVIPVLVIEDKGVFDAIRESWELFRKTWGENVVGQVSLAVVFCIPAFVGVLVVFATLLTGNMALFAVAIASFAIMLVVLVIIFSALNGIFVAALYRYAKSGTVPSALSPGLVQGAFARKSGGGTI